VAAMTLCRSRSIIDWRVDDPDSTGGEVPIDECTFHNSIFPPNRNMPIHVPCRRPVVTQHPQIALVVAGSITGVGVASRRDTEGRRNARLASHSD